MTDEFRAVGRVAATKYPAAGTASPAQAASTKNYSRAKGEFSAVPRGENAEHKK